MEFLRNHILLVLLVSIWLFSGIFQTSYGKPQQCKKMMQLSEVTADHYGVEQEPLNDSPKKNETTICSAFSFYLPQLNNINLILPCETNNLQSVFKKSLYSSICSQNDPDPPKSVSS
jgi:hypothetical protein